MTIISDIRRDLEHTRVPRRLARVAPLYRGWMAFAFLLGWFVFRGLLIVTYVILVVPIGLVLRLAGKDLLDQKIAKDIATYWVDVSSGGRGRDRYEKKF